MALIAKTAKNFTENNAGKARGKGKCSEPRVLRQT